MPDKELNKHEEFLLFLWLEILIICKSKLFT